MIPLSLAGVSLRRLLRDRISMFFIVVLPVLVILIIGVTISGQNRFRVGLLDQGSGRLGGAIRDALTASSTYRVHPYGSEGAARTALRRGEVDTVLILPAGMDADLRAGRNVQLVVLGDEANTTEQAATMAIGGVVADQASRVFAARFATARAGGSLDVNLQRADSLSSTAPRVEAHAEPVTKTSRYLPAGYSYSAPTMLVLFVFLNALAGGAIIVRTKQLGLYDRMLSAPVRPSTLVVGEVLCYVSIALLQSGLIVAVGALVFGVDWGAPDAAVALVAVWALVGAAAGMLSGTAFRTPEQASSVGPPIGIALGMLGGCMWPLEIVGPAMRTVGHLVPHAWAVDAWVTLLSKAGGLGDIARNLAILAAWAVALFALATRRLRRILAA